MLKYQCLFAFTVMKEMIALLTFVYLISRFETCWNIASWNLLRHVSVLVLAGTSFCSLCQNLRKSQTLFHSLKVCISLSDLFLLSLGCQK